MTSNNKEKDNIFSIGWKDNFSGRRFFVNFVSDSRELSSIKLPDFMLKMCAPGGYTSALREIYNMVAEMEEDTISPLVMSSFDHWYGNSMPRIHLGENGNDFVMDIHIYEGHSKIIKLLPSSRPMMWLFLFTIQQCIHKRIMDVINDPNLWLDLSPPTIQLFGKRKSTGRRVKREEILSYITGLSGLSRDERRLNPTSAFKVGDLLFSLGMYNTDVKRSVYWNLVADNKPESLSFPQEMSEISKLTRVEARRESELNSNEPAICRVVDAHLYQCFMRLYEKQGPIVYLAKNNKDLVFTVPFRIDQVPMWWNCLGHWRSAYFANITTFHRNYFLNESQRDDLVRNDDLNAFIAGRTVDRLWIDHIPFGRQPECEPSGRKATNKEIYSVLLKSKETAMLEELSRMFFGAFL